MKTIFICIAVAILAPTSVPNTFYTWEVLTTQEMEQLEREKQELKDFLEIEMRIYDEMIREHKYLQGE